MMIAISKAIAHVGGKAALARGIGVQPAYIYQWETGRRPVPAERCIQIERVTCGAVTCEELRPDVDWGYLRGRPEPQKEPA